MGESKDWYNILKKRTDLGMFDEYIFKELCVQLQCKNKNGFTLDDLKTFYKSDKNLQDDHEIMMKLKQKKLEKLQKLYEKKKNNHIIKDIVNSTAEGSESTLV